MLGQAMLRQPEAALCKKPLPPSRTPRNAVSRKNVVTVNAVHDQVTDRRATLGVLAGVAALLTVQPAEAAFGEGANIFGKPTNTTGLIPYKGNGFSLSLPSRWTVSHEKDVPNLVLRYEDTGDQLSSLSVFKIKGGNVGDPKKFLTDNAYIFGENVWLGNTISEGGFKKNQVSAANVIDSHTENKDGKQYTKVEVLTRTADGTEGGRHNLITVASGGGDTWVCRVQMGEKRWFRGADKFGKAVHNSFTVA